MQLDLQWGGGLCKFGSYYEVFYYRGSHCRAVAKNLRPVGDCGQHRALDLRPQAFPTGSQNPGWGEDFWDFKAFVRRLSPYSKIYPSFSSFTGLLPRSRSLASMVFEPTNYA